MPELPLEWQDDIPAEEEMTGARDSDWRLSIVIAVLCMILITSQIWATTIVWRAREYKDLALYSYIAVVIAEQEKRNVYLRGYLDCLKGLPAELHPVPALATRRFELIDR
jgi:hypothetical protein